MESTSWIMIVLGLVALIGVIAFFVFNPSRFCASLSVFINPQCREECVYS